MAMLLPLGPLDNKSSQPGLRHKELAWPGAYCLILPKMYKKWVGPKWISEAALQSAQILQYKPKSTTTVKGA